MMSVCFFFFSSRRRHTRCGRDWSSDVCSSDLVNYLEPKGNLDINWENVVIMKLTDNINMRLLIHMIYDENVLFPVHDANGVVIDNKPKVQLREFFTIGFAYKINRQVTRTRRK